MRVTVSEMMASPPLPAVARKMLSDAVSNALPVMSDSTRNNVISVGDYDLQLSGKSTLVTRNNPKSDKGQHKKIFKKDKNLGPISEKVNQ